MTRYRVRKQSGRTTTYVVVDGNGSRVTTHPHKTAGCAQAEADRLNVGSMVKDFADDPRPYAVRLSEAEAAYIRLKEQQP